MKNNKKHIVIISTWYPPLKHVAVPRIEAFSKYLDKDKFDVTVVTLSVDESIEEINEKGVDVIRLGNKSLFKLPDFNKQTSKPVHYAKVLWKLFVLRVTADEYKGWAKDVGSFLTKLHQTKEIDLVISSSAPLTPHKIAFDFCKSHSSIKWVADLRDELSTRIGASSLVRKKSEEIEGLINKRADAFLSVSKPIVDDFKTLLSNVKESEEIRNGYNHDVKFSSYEFNKQFTIGYFGTFYSPNKPDLFFECMEELQQEKILPDDWMIQFVGTPKNFTIPPFLKNNIEFIPKKSYADVIKLARACDINLLVLNFAERLGVYSGKLFDYISVRKPILALVNKNDVAAKLIKEVNAGYIAEGEDKKDVKKQIMLAISNWKSKTQLMMNTDKINLLHRKHQVKKLEILIDKLLANK